jgi:tetratricopeptide (TPR) repeat protein
MGLFAWRWLTTLLAFAVLWLTARRMGARGLAPFVVMVACVLVYRQRSQVRPETLVAVLMAVTLWILEMRRQGGPDRTWLLVLIACVWINAHVSYHLGFALLGIHWLDAAIESAGRRGRAVAKERASRRTASGLAAVGLVALAVSFVNPFGWQALWQPFDYYLNLRHEPLFKTIGELKPVWVYWPLYWRNGFPLLLLGWPLLLGWRARRHGLDRVELLTCALFTWLGLSTARFAGFYVIIAAPYVSRDLSEWLARRRIGAGLPVGARAGAAAAFALGLTALELTGPLGGPRLAVNLAGYPVRACDFMAEQGVRGRGFNYFPLGGYQIYRFWPERDRLPFMDIHQSGSVWDREYYLLAQSDPRAWRTFDDRYRFDYVLLSHDPLPGERLPDLLDADSTWALVFFDDSAVLYVRRGGPLAGVARRFAYRKLPGGVEKLEQLRAECRTSPESCAVVMAELTRAVAGSPYNAGAHSLIANVCLGLGDYAGARRHLLAALAVKPEIRRAHERLGLIALEEGHPADALREFLAERRQGATSGIELRIGQAYRRMGNLGAARARYRRALDRDPANAEARDSLAALERVGVR